MNLDFLNSNLLFVFLGVAVALLGVGLAVFGTSNWLKKGNTISSRLDHFVAPEEAVTGEPNKRPIIPREISGSLFSRTIVSWIKSIGNFLERFTPKSVAEDLEHKLIIAGNPGNLNANSFFAIRIVVLAVGVFVAFLMNRNLANIDLMSIAFGGLVIILCWLLPSAWLSAQVRTRQDEIQRGLPDALDMLSVCASAGLGFDQSLQKISNYWDTELGHEMKRMTEEMELGLSRAEALQNMSNRLDVDELSQFTAILIQAEKIGMSYADVLHSQAIQMRVLRQLRAREMANKLPAKLIVPLALLIFPAIIAVILGPAIPTLFGLFQNF